MKKNEELDFSLYESTEEICAKLFELITSFEKYRNDTKKIKNVFEFCLCAIESEDQVIINFAIEPFCLILRGSISSKMENTICNKLKQLMNKKDTTIGNRERALYGYLLSFSALSKKQKAEWYSFLSNGRRFKYKNVFKDRPLYQDRLGYLWRYRQDMIRLGKQGRKIWEKHNKP